MPIYRGVRARRGYTKTSHHDFWALLLGLYQNLVKHIVHFPHPPVDLALFKAKIDQYSAAITATMSGAKIAFARRDSLREELTTMLLNLIGYVEHVSNDDPAIFVLSGLEAQPNARRPNQPLSKPPNPKVAHGFKSGEMRVWMPTSDRKIKRCDVRFVPVDANGVPTAEWTETAIANFQGPTTIKNLQPGTRYAFQIRALGALGQTDWSDSAIKMCT